MWFDSVNYLLFVSFAGLNVDSPKNERFRRVSASASSVKMVDGISVMVDGVLVGM